MSNGYFVFKNCRVGLRADMNDGQVLNVCPGADADVIDIASNHGAEPHARIFTDLDIADYYCVVSDKCGFVDRWRD
jgi:hypothetical protein